MPTQPRTRIMSPRLVSILGYAAAPPGYPMPAPPYPYPMVAPPQPMTPQGLGYIRWSVLLGAVMQAVAIPGYIWLAVLVQQFPRTGPLNLSELFTLVASSLLFSLLTGIVGLIAVIFFALGFYYTHEGRDEYGPEHAVNTDHALFYFIVALVTAIIASFGGLGSVVGSLGSPSPLPVAALAGAFGVVRGLFVGLLLMAFIKVFTSKEDQTWGRMGTILLAASPAAGSAVAFAAFLAYDPANPASRVGLIVIAAVAASALAAVELVAFVLFYRVYSTILSRMRRGEFPAIVRPPIVYAPYSPPPGYYPPYPVYPSYPPATPPPAPPPEKPP